MSIAGKLFSLFILNLFCIVHSVSSQELLLNGDLEKGIPKGLVLKNAAIVNEGGKVLKLEGKDSTATIKDIKTKPGQRYKLSYRVKAGSKTLTSNGYQEFKMHVSWLYAETEYGTVWIDSFPDGFQNKELIFTAPPCVKPMTIFCGLKDAGSLYLDDFKLEELAPEKLPDLSINIYTPCFKNIIYSTDPVSEVKGSVIANKNVFRAELKLSEKTSGAAFFEKTFSNIDDKFDFSIPVENLKYGKYLLSIVPVAKDGQILPKVEVPIWKLEKASVEVIFKNDRNCYINGKLFYPVSFFHPDGTWPGTPKDTLRHAFYSCRRNGVNTFLIYPGKLKDITELLDAAKEYDCKLIISFGYPRTMETYPAWKKNILNILQPHILRHEALLGYYLADEPMWAGIPLEKLLMFYNFMKETDPYRPVWMNEAPRGELKDLKKYAGATDIAGFDIYPIPAPNPHCGLEDKTLPCVGKYTQTAEAATDGQKPVWMVLQGFSWGTWNAKKPEIYPTAQESDFIAFGCIANGAASIAYWGMHCINQPGFYDILFGTTRKLADLSGVTTLPDAPKETVKCDNPAIRFLTKEKDGNIYIIAVNESDKEQEAKFSGKIEAAQIDVVFENRKTPYNKVFIDKIAAYGYQIYATGKLPEPIVKPIPVNADMEKTDSPLIYKAKNRMNTEKYPGKAQWIWVPDKNKIPYSKAAFKKEFAIDSMPAKAEMTVTADDKYILWINGKKIAEAEGWDVAETYDILQYMKQGINTIYIEAADAGNAPCGLLADISIIDGKGNTSNIISDSSWISREINKISDSEPSGFTGKNAEKIADSGTGPWGNRLFIKTRQ